MAVKLRQVSKAGALHSDNPGVEPSAPVPHYDSTVTTKSAAIGSAIQLDATTTVVSMTESAGTGFKWGIVATEGGSLPANSPECNSANFGEFWSVGKSTGAARWFKTAALS